MKKLYLLFGFALMGLLFFACQKDEPVVEQIAINSTEMLSVERTVDCSPCINMGGCCCRLISNQGYGNDHEAELCFANTIIELQQAGGSMSGGNLPNFCTIDSSSCNPQDISGWSYTMTFPNDVEENPSVPDSLNPYFGHGWYALFCSPSGNLFKVCNPEPFSISMVFNCELDVQGAWQPFTLAPFECKTFRIQNCEMIECL